MWILRKTKTNFLTPSFFFLAVLIIDQGTKLLWSADSVINTGISFGFASNISWLFLLVLALSGVWLLPRFLPVPTWSQALFWGGVASNILDRIFFDGVRDIWVIPGTNIMNNFADWVIAGVAVYWMYNLAKRTDLQRETR